MVQCLIPPGTVARLYHQITHLKQEFDKRLQSGTKISPFELLEQIVTCWDERTQQIGKEIAKRYQSSLKKMVFFERPAPERLTKAAGKAVHASQSSSITLSSLIGHLPTREDFESQLYHPREALKELALMSCLYEAGVQLNTKGEQLEVKVQENHQLSVDTQRMLLKLLVFKEGLTYLCLPHLSALDNTLFEQILKKHCRTLKTLYLKGCREITFAPLIQYASQLSQLEEIVISGEHLGDLCGPNRNSICFPQLKKFVWLEAGENRASVMLEAPLLQQIHLTQNLKLNLVGHTLKSFTWKNGPLTNQELEQIMRQHPQLKILNIRGCQAFTHLPQHGCLESVNISLTSISKIAGNYPALVKLRADGCPKLAAIELENLLLEVVSTNNCPSLEECHVASPALKSVNMANSPKVNLNDGNLFVNSPLEYLDLSGHQQMTVEHIQQILERHPSLRELYLNDCLTLKGNLVIDTPDLKLRKLYLKNTNLSSLTITAPELVELGLKENLVLSSNLIRAPDFTVVDLSNFKGNAKSVLEEVERLPEMTMKIVSLNLVDNDDVEALSQKWDLVKNMHVGLSCELSMAKLMILLARLPLHIFHFKINLRGRIGNEGVQALAEALPQSHITQLDLNDNNIGNEGAQALALALPQSHITQLKLHINEISDEGAQALALALPQSHITLLYLSRNNIGNEGAQALALALPQSHITQLYLGQNAIGNEGAEALALALPQSHITQLYLSWNNIGNEGAQALALALPQSHITQLDLGWNKIGNEGAQALALALPQSCITQLYLSSNEIGKEGAKTLALALPRSRITQLDLSENQIGKEGAQALALALPQSHITQLDLGQNAIGKEGARALVLALPQSHITQLALRSHIGAEGAQALALALPQSHITELDLWNNNIGNEGAKTLALALPQSHITQLDLWNNNIGNEGAQALARVLPQSHITELNLSNNNIGHETPKP